jgi:phage shock protein PspC (stress-responsive transcriptional regulator)
MEKKLQRNEQDQRIAGVCSGLADFFDIDVTWVRIAFVVALVAGPGVLAYIILWIAVPKKPYIPNFGQFNADNTVNSGPMNTSQAFDNPKKKDRGNLRLIAGVLFIIFGLIFLMDELDLIPDWMDIENLWPLILVGMGLYILSAGVNNNKVDVVEPEVSKTDEPENESIATDTNKNEPINSNTDDTTEKIV